MSVLEGSKIFLVSNSSDYILEDMSGWSLSEVKTYASLLKVNLEIEGTGYVTSQSIAPSTLVNEGDNLKVVLSK